MNRLLDGNEFGIPIFIENDIYSYLKNNFESYRERIEIAYFSDTFIDKEINGKIYILDEVISAVLESIELYSNGYLADSYYKIEALLNKYPDELITKYLKIEKGETFYRGRISNGKLNANQQFHIPFSKRRLANSYRYSVLGLPCLYLGKSIQVCWEELSRPNIRDLQVSIFKARKDIEIYDLSRTFSDSITFIKRHMGALVPALFYELKKSGLHTYIVEKGADFFLSRLPLDWTPEYVHLSASIINDEVIDNFLNEVNMSIMEFIDELIKLVYINKELIGSIYMSNFVNYVRIISNSVLLHPLKIACSITVAENIGIYKPEYIIPQHIMQWIRANHESNGVMGIKYLSTKIMNSSNVKYDDRALYVNYAFPVLNVDNEVEYCTKLSDLFNVSDSYSINELDIKTMVAQESLEKPMANIFSESPLGNPYSKSYFYYLEKHLKNFVKLHEI